MPLKYALDVLLEKDVGTTHSQSEMQQCGGGVGMPRSCLPRSASCWNASCFPRRASRHVSRGARRGPARRYLRVQQERGELDGESAAVAHGALAMNTRRVREVMTPLEDVYCLADVSKLNFAAVRDIFQQGFSRVPVYSGLRENVVGLLFAKDLIFVDPEDDIAVADVPDRRRASPRPRAALARPSPASTAGRRTPEVLFSFVSARTSREELDLRRGLSSTRAEGKCSSPRKLPHREALPKHHRRCCPSSIGTCRWWTAARNWTIA